MIFVAAYCRVSTDREDQANSFETQKAYFRSLIRSNPEWELYDIYADEGITGTSTRKRREFNRMINDAYAGRFRLILTKEVSRFSRNILDTIAYTRELRTLGIGVLFATDRINTLEPESELLLSYIAAQSQEESRRTSARVVWGQTRQMEKGVVFGRSLLGYDVKDGQISVNPQEAETVRLIFHKYALEQMGTSAIARYLTEKGCQTRRGSTRWTSDTVLKILKNEKYSGDLVQKKTYTPDYLTHQKKRNTGQVPLITIKNHHEPIISREVWQLTKERLQQNNKHQTSDIGHSNRYIFSGKIKCGQCGSSFVGRVRYRKDGTCIRRWSCGKSVREGVQGCDASILLRDDDAMEMLKTVLQSLPLDKASVIAPVLDAIQTQQDPEGIPNQIQREIHRILRKKEAAIDACFSGEISREDMITMNRLYDERLTRLQIRLEQAQSRQESEETLAAQLLEILTMETPSQVFCKSVVQSITVFKDRHMELRLNLLPQVFQFQF